MPPIKKKGGASSTRKRPVCYFATQGPRDYMEDTHQILHFQISGKPATFYGVFDGHGGTDVSHELVHKTRGLFPFLVKQLRAHVSKNGFRQIPDMFKNAYLKYDMKLFQMNKKAGSTAIVALKLPTKIYLVNLGDSRGMIFSNKSFTTLISEDHKPNKLKERKRIYGAGHYVNPIPIYDNMRAKSNFVIGDVMLDRNQRRAYMYINEWVPISGAQYRQIKDRNAGMDTPRVSNSLALSRAFGDFYLKKNPSGRYMGSSSAVSMIPDVQEFNLAGHKGKFVYIFLASDGFWDVNRNTKTLRDNIMNNAHPQKYCQYLVENSINKGSQDNTTVVFDQLLIK